MRKASFCNLNFGISLLCLRVSPALVFEQENKLGIKLIVCVCVCVCVFGCECVVRLDLRLLWARV